MDQTKLGLEEKVRLKNSLKILNSNKKNPFKSKDLSPTQRKPPKEKEIYSENPKIYNLKCYKKTTPDTKLNFLIFDLSKKTDKIFD